LIFIFYFSIDKSSIEDAGSEPVSISGATGSLKSSWDLNLPYTSMNGLKRSMGIGNRVVELFSVATSLRVWRYLSWRATGALCIILAASASLYAA
jgi:hypothetical protein